MEYKREKVNKMILRAAFIFYGIIQFIGAVLTYSDFFDVQINYSNIGSIASDVRIYVVWILFFFVSTIYVVMPALILVSCIYAFEKIIVLRFGVKNIIDIPIYISRYIGIGEIFVVFTILTMCAYISTILIDAQFYMTGVTYFFVIFVNPAISLIIHNEVVARGLYPSGRTWSVLFSWHNIRRIFLQV